jgi:hypothetical protein
LLQLYNILAETSLGRIERWYFYSSCFDRIYEGVSLHRSSTQHKRHQNMTGNT